MGGIRHLSREERRYTLVTLLDMVLICGDHAWTVLHSLGALVDSFAKSAHKEPGSFVVEADRALIVQALALAENTCMGLGLRYSSGRVIQFKSQLAAPIPYAVAKSEMHSLRVAILKELGDIRFGVIQPDNLKYCEQEHLFGAIVNDVFPKSAPHIQSAGNCLAMELHTAAVFHLMLAVEFALRRLARRVRVRMKPLKHPLEQLEWGAVIGALDKKLIEIEKQKRSVKKSPALEFYRSAVRELKALKDMHRNPVMHARKGYTESEAINVFEHVRDFMLHLANHLKK